MTDGLSGIRMGGVVSSMSEQADIPLTIAGFWEAAKGFSLVGDSEPSRAAFYAGFMACMNLNRVASGRKDGKEIILAAHKEANTFLESVVKGDKKHG